MHAALTPVSLLSHIANRLVVVPSAPGRPPRFYWYLCAVTGSDSSETSTELARGEVAMTEEQWANYAAGGTREDDDRYEIACVLANEPKLAGFTLAT